jgi:hypothetical protein
VQNLSPADVADKLLSSLELELKCLSARQRRLARGPGDAFGTASTGKPSCPRTDCDGVTPRPRQDVDERPRRFTYAVEFSKIDAGRAGQQKDLCQLAPEAHK